jgi:hypothetical protein
MGERRLLDMEIAYYKEIRDDLFERLRTLNSRELADPQAYMESLDKEYKENSAKADDALERSKDLNRRTAREQLSRQREVTPVIVELDGRVAVMKEQMRAELGLPGDTLFTGEEQAKHRQKMLSEVERLFGTVESWIPKERSSAAPGAGEAGGTRP